MTYVSKTFYSPKNYMEPTKSVSGHVATTSGSSGVNTTTTSASIWNSSKVMLNKDTK